MSSENDVATPTRTLLLVQRSPRCLYILPKQNTLNILNFLLSTSSRSNEVTTTRFMGGVRWGWVGVWVDGWRRAEAEGDPSWNYHVFYENFLLIVLKFRPQNYRQSAPGVDM